MNQLNRVFDFETGTELSESILSVNEAQEQLVIEQGQQLENMRLTPGWKLVEDFCFSQIEAAKDKLLDAKDLDDIRRLQSLAAAFSNLLGAVDTMIRESAELKEAQIKQERDVESHNS